MLSLHPLPPQQPPSSSTVSHLGSRESSGNAAAFLLAGVSGKYREQNLERKLGPPAGWGLVGERGKTFVKFAFDSWLLSLKNSGTPFPLTRFCRSILPSRGITLLLQVSYQAFSFLIFEALVITALHMRYLGEGTRSSYFLLL